MKNRGYTFKLVDISVGVGDSFANAITVATRGMTLKRVICLAASGATDIDLCHNAASETDYFVHGVGGADAVGRSCDFDIHLANGLKVHGTASDSWLFVFEVH